LLKGPGQPFRPGVAADVAIRDGEMPAAADHACLSHAAGLNRLEVVDLHLDRTDARSAAASHIGCHQVHETELLCRVARAQPLVQLLGCQVLDRSK
jgi:hypothetical protein